MVERAAGHGFLVLIAALLVAAGAAEDVERQQRVVRERPARVRAQREVLVRPGHRPGAAQHPAKVIRGERDGIFGAVLERECENILEVDRQLARVEGCDVELGSRFGRGVHPPSPPPPHEAPRSQLLRVSFCHFELAGPRETALFSFESPAASHDIVGARDAGAANPSRDDDDDDDPPIEPHASGGETHHPTSTTRRGHARRTPARW